MQESPYLKDKEELVTKFKAIPFFKTIDKGYIKEILNLARYGPMIRRKSSPRRGTWTAGFMW